MTKVIVEIDGERHRLVKDKGTFELECVKCSLTDKCNRLEAICVRRGSLADDTTILKIRWCKLHRSEYWDKCWTAWAGRAFMPIHCEGCEFFIEKFADTKRNELFCR